MQCVVCLQSLDRFLAKVKACSILVALGRSSLVSSTSTNSPSSTAGLLALTNTWTQTFSTSSQKPTCLIISVAVLDTLALRMAYGWSSLTLWTQTRNVSPIERALGFNPSDGRDLILARLLPPDSAWTSKFSVTVSTSSDLPWSWVLEALFTCSPLFTLGEEDVLVPVPLLIIEVIQALEEGS